VALLLTNARLADGRLVDIFLRGESLESIEPAGVLDQVGSESIDLAGQLVTPGLRDPHIHPDKAFGLEDDTGAASTLAEAIARVRAQKPEQTSEMIKARTIRLVEWCLRLGTTRARMHAEVDPLLGLRSVAGVLSARAELADRFHLEVVAFPQEGIVREPGTLSLMRDAMRMGCDVVGAISYQDADARVHLGLAASLAREFDAPLDVHADFGVSVQQSCLELVSEIATAFDLRGRVTVGHCTTLAAMDEATRERSIAQLRDAGVRVVSLPRTDLYMDRRVAPLDLLWQAGVPAFVGTNNVVNAFTPVGRPSLPSVAAVYALAARQGSREFLDKLAVSLWQGAELAPGAVDLCVWPVQEPWQLVANEAEPSAVLVRGRFVYRRADASSSAGRRLVVSGPGHGGSLGQTDQAKSEHR
jgi:cytosine deaminase